MEALTASGAERGNHIGWSMWTWLSFEGIIGIIRQSLRIGRLVRVSGEACASLKPLAGTIDVDAIQLQSGAVTAGGTALVTAHAALLAGVAARA